MHVPALTHWPTSQRWGSWPVPLIPHEPVCVAPSVHATTTYTISLVVTDTLGLASAPDTVTITVTPH